MSHFSSVSDSMLALEELHSLGFISDEELARRSAAPSELTLNDFQTVLQCTCEESCGEPHMCLRCGEGQFACQVRAHAGRCNGNWLPASACPNAWQGCEAMLNRVTYGRHIEHECAFADVLCKCVGESGHCLEAMRRGALAAHMAEKHAKQTAAFCRQEVMLQANQMRLPWMELGDFGIAANGGQQ
jgi:hypothetical protein